MHYIRKTNQPPLDDAPDGDIADAAFALKHLGPHLMSPCMRIRLGSRLQNGLIALSNAGVIQLSVARIAAAGHVHLAFWRRRG